MDENDITRDFTYFYPNCCHVCKRWDVQLISCAKCQMISYCKDDHQRDHLPKHEQICTVIKLILENKKYMNTEEISSVEWLEIRRNYLTRAKKELGREMTKEEMQMFLFAKACVVCYRQDALIPCNDCPSAAFCDKHRDASEHREKFCKLMRQCFELKKCVVKTERLDTFYIYGPSDLPFHDMMNYINTYVPVDTNNVHFRILHANLLSKALTLYFCMKKLDLNRETLSIHIVETHTAASQADSNIWVILFTLIPILTKLTITFIKPKPAFNKRDTNTRFINISETKKFVAHVGCMLYEEYVNTTDFEKPNLIVGFHAIFAHSDAKDKYANISEESGRALAEQKCPCILTFDDLDLTDKDMLNKIEKYSFRINPFRNLMPFRHILVENIYYLNNYLIIFNNLDSSKVFINSENQCVLFP